MKSKYLYHCTKCGMHKECATKEEFGIIRRQHRQRCDLGKIPLVNGTTILVRDDIVADYHKWLEKNRKLDEEDRARARTLELQQQGERDGQTQKESNLTT